MQVSKWGDSLAVRLPKALVEKMGLRASLDDVLPVTLNTHTGAVSLAREHGLSFYDALIAAAAIEGSCDTLFSEDMQHGCSIGGLAIVNPFVDSER
jgi:predicted nucleic acid-binding protein